MNKFNINSRQVICIFPEQDAAENFYYFPEKFKIFLKHIGEYQYQSIVSFSITTTYYDGPHQGDEFTTFYNKNLIIINKNTTFESLISSLNLLLNEIEEFHRFKDDDCSYVRGSEINKSNIKIKFFKLEK